MDARLRVDAEQLRRRFYRLQAELSAVEQALRETHPVAPVAPADRPSEADLVQVELPSVSHLSSTLFHLLPGAVIVHQQGRIVLANAEAARLIGVDDPEEAVGLPVLSLVPPERHEYVRKRIETVERDGRSVPPQVQRFVNVHGRSIFAEVAGRAVAWNGAPAVLAIIHDVTEQERATRALTGLVRSTTGTGQDFFVQLTQSLAETLDVDFVIVTRIAEDEKYLAPVAACGEREPRAIDPYPIDGTPCGIVLERGEFFCPEGIQELFPEDGDLKRLGLSSYYGVRADASDGRPLGKLCILDRRPMRMEPWLERVMKAFAGRVGAELERLEAESRLEASEARFRTLFHDAPEAVLLVDRRRGAIVEANAEAGRLLGTDPSRLAGVPLARFDHPAGMSLAKLLQGNGNGGRETVEGCVVVCPAAGPEFPCEVSAKTVDIGAQTGLLVHLRDAEEQRKLLAVFAFQTHILDRLVRGDAIDDVLVSLCREMERLVPGGVCLLTQVDASGKFLSPVVAPSLPEAVLQGMGRLAIGPANGSCPAAVYHGRPIFTDDVDQDPCWEHARDFARRLGIRACWSSPFYQDDRIVGTISLSHRSQRKPTLVEDRLLRVAGYVAGLAMQRRAADQRLREREDQLQAILHAQSDPLWMLDATGRIRYFNHPIGGGESPQIGRPWSDVLPVEWHPQLQQALATVQQSGRPFEYELPWPDGDHPRWFCLRVSPVHEGRDRFGFTLAFNDITRLKLSQERLRKDYSRFHALTEAVPGGIFQTDEEGKIIFVTKRFEEIFGRGRNQIKDPYEYVRLAHPEERDAAWKDWVHAFRTHSRFEREVRIERDGVPRTVRVIAEPVGKGLGLSDGFIGFVMDVSDARDAEDALRARESELRHVSRLATMGQLVAEFAHEINQPLYAISNYAHAITNYLSQLDPQAHHEVVTWGQRIASVAQDAGQIIRRLRTFTSGGSSEVADFDLVSVIHESLRLLEWDTRRYGVHVELHGCHEPVIVHAGRIEIQQVVVNLLKNALESLAEVPRNQRKLEVVVRAAADRTTVSVLDRGAGLPTDDPEQLFPAFVTYKSRGTGMGLAVSRTIVERFGGSLTGTARPGGGAEFTFHLPRTADQPPPSDPPVRS